MNRVNVWGLDCEDWRLPRCAWTAAVCSVVCTASRPSATQLLLSPASIVSSQKGCLVCRAAFNTNSGTWKCSPEHWERIIRILVGIMMEIVVEIYSEILLMSQLNEPWIWSNVWSMNLKWFKVYIQWSKCIFIIRCL